MDRRWPISFGWFRRQFNLQLHHVFWSSGITRLVLGIVPIGFFPQTPSFTNLSSVDAPDRLTGHSYLLHSPHDFVGTRGLTCVQNAHYLGPNLPTVGLQGPVTLCAVARFTSFHLHKVPGGDASYILRTGSDRTHGGDIYRVIRCVPSIVSIGVGTPLPRRPVMTRRPNAGAGGGCYLFPSAFVCVKVG